VDALGLGLDCYIYVAYLVLPLTWNSTCELMALSLGTDFTLVLTESGSVYAFGTNRNGQLGLGNLRNQLIPALLEKVDAFAGEEVTMVSAGHVHSACVTRDGNAWVWGSNLWEQAGLDQIAQLVQHGPAHDILRPALIPRVLFGNSPALMVACGEIFTLLLTAAGHVWSAGCKAHGQLGHNDTLHKNAFTLIDPVYFSYNAIGMIAVGRGHSTALTREEGILMT